MKRTLTAILTGLAFATGAIVAMAQGTAFTYLGQLNDGGNPANGNYDLQFALCDASENGNQIAGPVINSPTLVGNGMFSVVLDFGGAAFPGSARWLEIGVRPTGSDQPFSTLAPRQPITAVPYAITAGNVTGPINGASILAGTVTAEQLTAVMPGVGQWLAYDGASLVWADPMTSTGAWSATGNSGTAPGVNFLGTTDNQPLELRVNGKRALRLEPNGTGPNVIGGFSDNMVAPGVYGATIAGGGDGWGHPNVIKANVSTIAGGSYNSIDINSYNSSIGGGYFNIVQSNADRAVIGGGGLNTASGSFATVGGGYQNVAGSSSSTVGGGSGQWIAAGADHSFIGGGSVNYIGTNAYQSLIAGGEGNTNLSNWASMGGGWHNVLASAPFGVVSGGQENVAFGDHATVAGGYLNKVSGSFGTIAGGDNNRAGSSSTVSGGQDNSASYFATVCGGENNGSTNFATVCGGVNNSATDWSTVGGGALNVASGYHSAVSGGYGNSARGYNSAVPGGENNMAYGMDSFAAGHDAKALHDGCFVWSDSLSTGIQSTANDQFVIGASGGVILVGNTSLSVGSSASFASSVNFASGATFHGRVTCSAGADCTGVSTFSQIAIGLGNTGYQLQLSDDRAAKPNGGSWANSSDARIKKNIHPLAGALDKLTQLRGVTFEWINPEDHANQTNVQLGFIAQEIERVFPDWVTQVGAAEHDKALTADGKIRSLSLPFAYDALVVEAIKEQQAEIKARGAEIEALKKKTARVDELEQRLAALERLLKLSASK